MIGARRLWLMRIIQGSGYKYLQAVELKKFCRRYIWANKKLILLHQYYYLQIYGMV